MNKKGLKMITFDKEVNKNKLRMAQAIQSSVVISAVCSTIKRKCKKFGVITNQELNFSLKTNAIQVMVRGGALYDAMMNSEHSSISNTETISCYYNII